MMDIYFYRESKEHQRKKYFLHFQVPRPCISHSKNHPLPHAVHSIPRIIVAAFASPLLTPPRRSLSSPARFPFSFPLPSPLTPLPSPSLHRKQNIGLVVLGAVISLWFSVGRGSQCSLFHERIFERAPVIQCKKKKKKSGRTGVDPITRTT